MISSAHRFDAICTEHYIYQADSQRRCSSTFHVTRSLLLELSLNTMAPYLFMFSLAILVTSASANATGLSAPSFNDFKVTTIYQGAPAQVILKSEDEKAFRTRLREAAKHPVNFAGQNVLATWGCGTGCLYGAAVNKKTGTVTFLPGTVSGWQGKGERVMFHRNSRLLTLAGVIDEGEEHGLHYYELVNGNFKHVASNAVPTPN